MRLHPGLCPLSLNDLTAHPTLPHFTFVNALTIALILLFTSRLLPIEFFLPTHFKSRLLSESPPRCYLSVNT